MAGCIVLMLWITSSGYDPSLKLWDSWGLAALVPSLSPDRWYLELMYISTIRRVRVRVGVSVRLGVKAPLPPVAGAPLPLPLPLPLNPTPTPTPTPTPPLPPQYMASWEIKEQALGITSNIHPRPLREAPQGPRD